MSYRQSFNNWQHTKHAKHITMHVVPGNMSSICSNMYFETNASESLILKICFLFTNNSYNMLYLVKVTSIYTHTFLYHCKPLLAMVIYLFLWMSLDSYDYRYVNVMLLLRYCYVPYYYHYIANCFCIKLLNKCTIL